MSHIVDPFSKAPAHRLFSIHGIEIEYMIVARKTLDVRPLASKLLRSLDPEHFDEVRQGDITYGNELVEHVIELKVSDPVAALEGVAERFHEHVGRINARLAPLGARLLPGAMHPWMDPWTETVLWRYENHEIYERFDQLFNCRRHGWANLQSMHINLPFAGDDEFGRLHAAIRVVLPLLPALAASSPWIDCGLAPTLDTRLEVYRTNATRLPEAVGRVIPEPAFTRAEYETQILAPIAQGILRIDRNSLSHGVLEPEWTNARGAIARFGRGSIEIRVLDAQETPHADLAIAALVVATLKRMVEDRPGEARRRALDTAALERTLLATIRDAEAAVIDDADLLACLGWHGGAAPAGAVWRRFAEELGLLAHPEFGAPLRTILTRGTLATRLRRAADPAPARERLRELAAELADCLAQGRMFDV